MNYFRKFLKTRLIFFGLCLNPNFHFFLILYKNLEIYYSDYIYGLRDSISFNLFAKISYIQACRNEKNSGGLGVYKKILANLVSRLRRSFNWNCLKCPELLNRLEVSNANSQHKWIFVKYLWKVSSQSFQKFQLTGVLQFRCRF